MVELVIALAIGVFVQCWMSRQRHQRRTVDRVVRETVKEAVYSVMYEFEMRVWEKVNAYGKSIEATSGTVQNFLLHLHRRITADPEIVDADRHMYYFIIESIGHRSEKLLGNAGLPANTDICYVSMNVAIKTALDRKKHAWSKI